LSRFEIIKSTAIYDLGITNPKIAVLGLNPHSGEDGILGMEEIKEIHPLVKKFSDNFLGPFSPDTFFANHLYKKYDMVIGHYHDQVLIPFKMMNFNLGVNYTSGLPIIRTSPDHGVAYDIAGGYKADENSMYQAFIYAKKIIANRMKMGIKRNEPK
jgi:4-hydroxythreonine-4-phosphate dehydrogenase